MSFEASINSAANQLIWGKCLSTLSQIHTDVFITITEKGLLVSAMNATDTTMAKVRLPREFFSQFSFAPRKIVFGEDGVQQITDCKDVVHTIYSFKVNGKYLSLLCLKQEDTIKDFMLTIDNCEGCSEGLMNKLVVKMKTDSLLCKEYQVNFEPLESVQIILSLKYKQKFLSVYNNKEKCKTLDPRLVEYFKTVQDELEDDMFNKGIAHGGNIITTTQTRPLTIHDEINFLSFDQSILRNFVDSIMSSVIEEMKLELTKHSLNMIGFTKAVYNTKSHGYLKQAVTITNSCSANDLEHYCVFSTEGSDSSRPASKSNGIKKSTTFKLRDFKTFLNGLNCWKTNDMIRIWFCQPGDPILFEITKDGVVLELVQVTDAEGRVDDPEGSMTPSSEPLEKTVSPIKKDSVMKLEKVHKPDYRHHHLHPQTKRTLFVTDNEDDDTEVEKFKFKRWGSKSIQNDKNPGSGSQSNHFDQSESHTSQMEPAKRIRTTVEWGGTYETNAAKPEQPDDLNARDKNALLAGLKRQALADTNREEDDESQMSDSMGPTQVDKPKGLFDA